jgi:hypothetical protein
MAHQEAELSDVIVVLVDEPGMPTPDAADKLRNLGLAVSHIDQANGVVEGAIETAKIQLLRQLKFVKYVRNVFNYIAEGPDNLDNDGDLSSEADDAGT